MSIGLGSVPAPDPGVPTGQVRAKALIEDSDEKVVELLEVGVPGDVISVELPC